MRIRIPKDNLLLLMLILCCCIYSSARICCFLVPPALVAIVIPVPRIHSAFQPVIHAEFACRFSTVASVRLHFFVAVETVHPSQ